MEEAEALSSENKLHPCALFLHRLLLSVHYYSMNDKKLHAIKLALEEWHYFLEWTNHWNWLSIQQAKWLNLLQVRWALFFHCHFQFTLSFKPGSNNGKPDALFWLVETERLAEEPKLIISPKQILTPVNRDISRSLGMSRLNQAVLLLADCLFHLQSTASYFSYFDHSSPTYHGAVRCY